MKWSSTIFLCMVLCLLAIPMQSEAQYAQYEDDPATILKIGPRATIDVGDISDEFGGTVGIGAGVRLRSSSLPLQVNSAFDFYLVGQSWTVWSIDLNAVYLFGEDNQTFTPYSGVGLGITRWSGGIDPGGDGTDVGLNLVGGVEFIASSAITPFLQLQATVAGDLARLGITGGLLFGL